MSYKACKYKEEIIEIFLQSICVYVSPSYDSISLISFIQNTTSVELKLLFMDNLVISRYTDINFQAHKRNKYEYIQQSQISSKTLQHFMVQTKNRNHGRIH